MRPILRYHGGKWKLADWIIRQFPKHRVYVEPFGGAASVLICKPRSYGEIYNDLDGEIVNLFRVVRDRGTELRRQLEDTPFARDEYRLSFEASTDELEQARRTVIRSFMGFGSNSLCKNIKSGFRANANRSGTTPAHDWANYPKLLDKLTARLRAVVIENRDAIEVMQAHDSPETLHYCDPPYVHSTRSSKVHGHHGYTHEMSDEEHLKLSKYLHEVSGMVVLSGYSCKLYDELYKDWSTIDLKSLADGARKRTEVLWINAAAWRSGSRLF